MWLLRPSSYYCFDNFRHSSMFFIQWPLHTSQYCWTLIYSSLLFSFPNPETQYSNSSSFFLTIFKLNISTLVFPRYKYFHPSRQFIFFSFSNSSLLFFYISHYSRFSQYSSNHSIRLTVISWWLLLTHKNIMFNPFNLYHIKINHQLEKNFPIAHKWRIVLTF